MKWINYRLFLLILTAIFIVLAITVESLYFGDFEYHIRTKRFSRVLSVKERLAEDYLERFSSRTQTDISPEAEYGENYISASRDEGISLFQYTDGKLKFWSDNSFDVPLYFEDTIFIKPLVFIQNGWFLPKVIEKDQNVFVALIRIRSDYSLENDLIINGFEKDFRIPDRVEFSLDSTRSEYHVSRSDGKYLFSLVYPEAKSNTYIIIGPIFLWSLVFILILILLREMVKYFSDRGSKYLGIILNFAGITIIYLAVIWFKKPAVLFNTDLFSPYRFTMNQFLPSLGHLFLLSILLATFSYSFYKYYPLTERTGETPRRDFLFSSSAIMAGILMILLFHTFFRILVSTSNINFEPFKILNVNLFSLIGFASVFLLFLVPLFYLLKIFSVLVRINIRTLVFSIVFTLLGFPVGYKIGLSVDITIIVLYVLLVIMIWIYLKKKPSIFNLSVAFSVVFSIYSLYIIVTLSEIKETDNLKVLAVSYTNENDPVAEHLLLDIWPQLNDDKYLVDLLRSGYSEKGAISDWLQENYFNDYWGNYDFSVVLCRDDDPLQLGSENQRADNCFAFFNDWILKEGRKITGTDFYFMENQGGRAYYLGRLFVDAGPNTTNGLFIQLYSYVNSYQSGYPELLFDKNYQGFTNLRDYSFAKFINGELVLRTGDYPYGKSDIENAGTDNEYMVFYKEGFRHLLYTDGNVSVIIGKPELTAVNIIISFAYLFAFILLMADMGLVIIKQPKNILLKHFNFRQKLQLSFVSILLVSFIAIGIAVAFLSIKQYETKHLENIKEKLNSTYTELDHILSGEQQITTDWRDDSYPSLTDLLIRLSNVFYTDINLYDLKGDLMATSRPEVFYRDLISRRMNNTALYNLTRLNKTEFINSEKIGSLEYLSAYVPFYNIDGKLLAYLNLPYFRMQSVLAKEISDMIVTITNFSLLLIVLTMSLVVLISGRLTSPLRMLRSGLASVEIGKKSEHLNYQGYDEIGDLVKQYNRMVDEIEESAAKLSRSEREYAWREMAKQIAHEIKNPLTPMKLNVQQLLKSWHDGAPGFGKILDRFTQNQIEYIDNLSSIASEFSSFAKMPRANPSEIELLGQINSSLELFSNSENVKIIVSSEKVSKAFIYADKEHLNGIFSNLIKNAIQSVPSEMGALIRINIDVSGNMVTVSIADNGSGIPPELKNKMFTPNFTTKSSGMGLGLSIVKRFVETANGRIWFESETGKGSVFYIELPLLYTVDRV